MPKEQIAGLTIDFEPVAPHEAPDPIHAGLIEYNRRTLGHERYMPLRWIARDADGQVAAGLLGDLYFNWLYIAILWVREDQRGQGIGSRLMALAEEYAAKEGRTHVHVDTFDFQAPDFYRRHGYTEFGRLGPYGDGHIRFYFHKALSAVQPDQAAP